MPVFKQTNAVAPNHDELVAELAAELAGGSAAPDPPRIYEDEVPQARALHAIVVWERWRGVPAAARQSIIYDAYERVDPARMLRVKFAFGFTYDEAVAGGYLPYKVDAHVRPADDAIDLEKIRRRMVELGARETAAGLELRFPYRGLAEQAISDLDRDFGRGLFGLAQEVGSVGRWRTA